MHVHGGGGSAFSSADPDEITSAAAFHRRHGTTSLVASLVTAPLATLERQVATLADLVADGQIAGIHLEGPWLSASRAGAHSPRHLRHPTRADVQRLLAAGRGAVRMVTLAPELPGALEAISQLTAAGATVALGHTDATYAQTHSAIEAGARVATHLFNAMRPLHQREPGPALALLQDPRVTLELIADGLHVDAHLLRWVVDTAGPERVALVTDAILAAGASDGTYDLGGLRIRVRDGQPRLESDVSVLAGSTLTLDHAVARAVGTLGLSVDTAARLAAQVPAAALGLTHVGAIQPGARADLVVLDDAGSPQAIMRLGQWLTPPRR